MENRTLRSETVLKKTPYKEILNLFEQYSFITDGKQHGLSHQMILFAFLDKKKFNKYIKEKYQKEIQTYYNNFYSKNLQKKIEELFFKRGIIKYPKQLSDKLNLLIKKKWIRPKGKPRYYTYFLTNKYFAEKSVINQVDKIKSWQPYEIFISSCLKGPFEIPPIYLLCGLSKNELADVDRKTINEQLLNINKSLGKIYNLKKKNADRKNIQHLGFYWSV